MRKLTERPENKKNVGILTIEIHTDDTENYNKFLQDLQKLNDAAQDYEVFFPNEEH